MDATDTGPAFEERKISMTTRLILFALLTFSLSVGPLWRGLLPIPELRPDFYEYRSWLIWGSDMSLRVHARRSVLEQLEADPERRDAMADKLARETY